ncbi:hypothetical protein K501DRAFT_329255 [Backusella circina FSU 941]|nr:hypothetical protein K501DRAFT_329255 [Backusella circina FSU 941]
MKKIKTAVHIERQDAFLLESDEDLGSLESRTKRRPFYSLNDDDEDSFSIKCTVDENKKEKTALYYNKKILLVIVVVTAFLVLVLASCVECKAVSRDTLRALGDASDTLPIYLPSYFLTMGTLAPIQRYFFQSLLPSCGLL